jgi:hypothetical protein
MDMRHRATPLHRPWAAWLALFVALVMALAPTLSHALAWSQSSSGNFVEICTATGPRLVAADSAPTSADSPAGQESALSLSHCPFCLHIADRCAPPPNPLPYLFQVHGGQQEATVWRSPFFFTHFAFAPPPRGPPRAV